MFAGEGIYARVIGGASSYDWTIENSTLRFNHLAALVLGNQTQVLNNSICDNGKIGIMGGGTNILIENNEICRNNYAGYTGGQGGAKFDATTGLTVNGNNVHDNMGVGFHSDDGSVNTLYEYNTTTRNQGPAIDYEISHSAVIRYNTITDDAHNPLGTSPYWVRHLGSLFGQRGSVRQHHNQLVERYYRLRRNAFQHRGDLQPYKFFRSQ